MSMIDTLVAIDIAIEPDAKMVQRSLADNAALLKTVPQGYALDNTHHAHVSMLQRFVRDADTKFGAFTRALYDQAVSKGWIVDSIKRDWKRVFSFDP